jgi:hypothetical protein
MSTGHLPRFLRIQSRVLLVLLVMVSPHCVKYFNTWTWVNCLQLMAHRVIRVYYVLLFSRSLVYLSKFYVLHVLKRYPFLSHLCMYMYPCSVFRLIKSLQWCLGRKSWKFRRKKIENWTSRRMKTKQCAMKLSQVHRRIELCLREIILPFEMNLQNLIFSWQFNSHSYLKASTEVLSNWAVETLGG